MNMKEFLLLFWNARGSGNYITTLADMQEYMPRWQAWIGQIAMAGKLIATQPIDYKGLAVTATQSTPGPVVLENQLVTGYLLCRAESEEEVEKWSQNCPILKYPQGRVEIRPLLPFEM